MSIASSLKIFEIFFKTQFFVLFQMYNNLQKKEWDLY